MGIQTTILRVAAHLPVARQPGEMLQAIVQLRNADCAIPSGMIVRTQMSDPIFTADIKEGMVEEVINHPSICSVEFSRPLRLTKAAASLSDL